jgi:hypothetical protein
MDNAQTICALYSRGPHFSRVLNHLRKTAPQARIIALVPATYPDDYLEGLADEVVTLQATSGVAGLKEVRRKVKAGGADALVVMFDSPRLRLLARLCPVRQRWCYTIDGRFFPVRLALFRQVLQAIVRRIRGYLLYRRIRKTVYKKPVEPGKTPAPPV